MREPRGCCAKFRECGELLCHWCVHVFRWKDGYVLKRSLQFEIGGQRKKGRIEKKCEKQVKD